MSAPTCGELSCDECNARTDALTAERDQLRAELERSHITRDATCIKLAGELREARAVAAVAQWHPATVRPQPSAAGVLCDAYLAITLGSERPCVLTYIYASAQWTQGEGDTQRIRCWGHIVPVDWNAERDQLRAENKANHHELAVARNAECLARTQLDLARAELAAERARLDWLEKRGPWESWNGFGETGITLRENIRSAIDAAMKEGA